MKRLMLFAIIAFVIGCSNTSETDRYKYQVVQETGWKNEYTYCDSIIRISPFKVITYIDGVEFLVESENWIVVENNPNYKPKTK